MARTAVIGAGPTGLVCADALRGDVTVFEKSRAIGGRVATRAVHLDDGRPVAFDHGTPAVRAADSLFAGLLSDLALAGSARAWKNGLVVGTPRMRDLFGPLAHGITVRLETRVDALERVDGGWNLHLAPHETEGGRAEGVEGPFEHVVIAVPAHQARTLLEPAAPDLAWMLKGVHARPCWTLMAGFEGAAPRDGAGAAVADIEWLVREGDKPGRDDALRLWTLQMNGDWSAMRLEHDRERVLPILLEILRARTGEEGEPVIAMAHRWRYAHTATPLGEPFLRGDGLLVGGDWTRGACVEDAWRCGRAMATALAAGD